MLSPQSWLLIGTGGLSGPKGIWKTRFFSSRMRALCAFYPLPSPPPSRLQVTARLSQGQATRSCVSFQGSPNNVYWLTLSYISLSRDKAFCFWQEVGLGSSSSLVLQSYWQMVLLSLSLVAKAKDPWPCHLSSFSTSSNSNCQDYLLFYLWSSMKIYTGSHIPSAENPNLLKIFCNSEAVCNSTYLEVIMLFSDSSPPSVVSPSWISLLQ